MPSDIHVELSGGFSVKQGRLERLIRLLSPVMTLEEPACITIDLSRLVTVSPAALALLTATLKRVVDLDLLGQGSLIVPPISDPVHNYLLRMNLLRVLLGADDYDPEQWEARFHRHEPEGFRPCQHFTGQDDYPGVARALTEALTERCVTDRVAEASVRIALDEVCENVVHHADTSVGGFAAAQGWIKNREFEIAIADLGVGVRASLIKNPDYADTVDDVAAISRALEPRVSATPERNAGIGLFITRMLLEANGGLLFVRSGYGSVHAGSVNVHETLEVALPGTLVVLRARTNHPLDILSVYEQLEREHPSESDRDDASGG